MDNRLFIGEAIRLELKRQSRTVTWFADQLCCHRTNVYKLFKRDNIDIKQLQRIQKILGRDFSEYFRGDDSWRKGV